MKHRTRILSFAPVLFAPLAIFAGIAVLGLAIPSTEVFAQAVVTGPHETVPKGPSLDVTLRFLQEKLNDIGSVSVSMTAQDTAHRTSFSQNVTDTVGRVTADSGQCRISYHWRMENHGEKQSSTEFDGDIGFNLKGVKEIVIKSFSDFQNEKFAADGSPQITVYSSHPDVVMLELHGQHGAMNVFPFTDAEIADRVAKAFDHAVELCGGTKDPF